MPLLEVEAVGVGGTRELCACARGGRAEDDTGGELARERALGFDHSHNTNFNWDKYHNWLDYAEPAEAAKDA